MLHKHSLLFTVCLVAACTVACDSCEDDVAAAPEQDMGVRVEPPGPGEEPCGGCLDAEGDCQRGDADDACGVGGGTCAACEAGNICLDDSTCGEPPPCGPDTCDGCCDAAGACVAGDTSADCGSGGSMCTECGPGTACQMAACVMVEETCGPANCDGCCDAGGVCVGGRTDAACGAGGGACMDCGATASACAGGVCDGGQPSCAMTCQGCCEGETCVMLPDEMQCGAGGGACVACMAGEVCDTGACMPVVNPTSELWNLTVISAQVPPTKPGPSMQSWDILGGDPDPFMYVYSEDNVLGVFWENETPALTDSFAPVWNQLMFAEITNQALTEGVVFWLGDDEGAIDDICLQLEVIDPAMITNQDIVTTCTDDPRVTWTWRLDPVP